jgi:hypothetical protein
MADTYEKRAREKRKQQKRREKAERRRRERELGLRTPPEEMSAEEAWYGPEGPPEDENE